MSLPEKRGREVVDSLEHYREKGAINFSEGQRPNKKPRIVHDDTLRFDVAMLNGVLDSIINEGGVVHEPRVIKVDKRSVFMRETHDPEFKNVVKEHPEVAHFFIPSHIIEFQDSDITASVMDRGETDLEHVQFKNNERLLTQLMDFCYKWLEVSNECKIYYPDFKLSNLVFDKDMNIKFIDLNDVITLETLINSGNRNTSVHRLVISTFVQSVDWQRAYIFNRDDYSPSFNNQKTPPVVYQVFVQLHQFYSMVYTIMRVAEQVYGTEEQKRRKTLEFFNTAVGNNFNGLTVLSSYESKETESVNTPIRLTEYAKSFRWAIINLQESIEACYERLQSDVKAKFPVVFYNEYDVPLSMILDKSFASN